MSTVTRKGKEGWWTLETILSRIKEVDGEEEDGDMGFDDEEESNTQKLMKARARFICDGTTLEIKGLFYVLCSSFEYRFNGLYKNNVSTKGYSVFDTQKLDYRPKPVSRNVILELLVNTTERDVLSSWFSKCRSLPSRDIMFKKSCTRNVELHEKTLITVLKTLFLSHKGIRYFWFTELKTLEEYYERKGREFIVYNLNASNINWFYNIFMTGEKLEKLCFQVTKSMLNKKIRKLPELTYEKFEIARALVNSTANCCDPKIVNAISIYHEILRIDVYGHKQGELFNKSKTLLYKPFNDGHMYSEYGSITKHCRDKKNCEASLAWLAEEGITIEAPLHPRDFKDMHTKRHIYISQMWNMQERLIQHLKTVIHNWKKDGEEFGMTQRTGVYQKRSKRKLNEYQSSAVHSATVYPISVITGKGGTGKTEAVKYVVDLYGNDNPELCTVLFVGPTGCSAVNATKRVKQAYTIDKCAYALKKAASLERSGKLDLDQPQQEEPEYEQEDAMWYQHMSPAEHRLKMEKRKATEFVKLIKRWRRTEVLIIDEMSMVDIAKFEFLLRMLTHFASLKKIIIVGDFRQLQSICAGRIMVDLMEALPESVTELVKNMRNPSSTIFRNANICMSGKSGRLHYDNNFKLIKTHKDDNITQAITSLFTTFRKDSNFDVYDVHFITFRCRHAAAINKACRSFYTDHYQPRSDGKGDLPEFFVGEKIYFKKNNYEQGVMNGQIWIIRKYVDVLKSGGIREDIQSNMEHYREPALARVAVLSSEDGSTTLAIDLKDIPFTFKNVNLGYATTIHKFQGKEQRIIVYWMIEDHPFENVSHFYTAITRSTEAVILMSTENVICRTIQRKAPIRRSQFARFLHETLNRKEIEIDSDDDDKHPQKRQKIEL